MYTSGDGRSAASKFGQLIGEAFEKAVFTFIHQYLETHHPEYEILQSEEQARKVTLDMMGGSARQMDTIIAPKGISDPIALLESKWLKDARHHNDKGAWILQLREVKKKYPTIRGAVAVLAGYWTEGVGIMLMSEGGIHMVWVATDEEVYSTLQPYLDDFLGENTFVLDAHEMRVRYPRPWDLANFLTHLKGTGKLDVLAANWLDFTRDAREEKILRGTDLIASAISDLVSPLNQPPKPRQFQIAVQIDTGNTIYEEFADIEEAFNFMMKYNNPDEILKRITPRKRADDSQKGEEPHGDGKD